MPTTLHDEAGQHLIALSKRISRMVARLPKHAQAPAATRSEDRAAAAAAILRARSRRTNLLPGIEFGEPAWDMLLELYVAQAANYHLSVSSLCVASRVPATTALRWIDVLMTAGYVTREPDGADRRRIIVHLTRRASESLDAWLDDARTDAFV